MSAATAPIIKPAGWTLPNIHVFLDTSAPTGASAICGVFNWAATSEIASDEVTVLEPINRST